MGLRRMVGWILFIFAVILLVLMYQNSMDFSAVVQPITGWFGG